MPLVLFVRPAYQVHCKVQIAENKFLYLRVAYTTVADQCDNVYGMGSTAMHQAAVLHSIIWHANIVKAKALSLIRLLQQVQYC